MMKCHDEELSVMFLNFMYEFMFHFMIVNYFIEYQ